ncbi:MAG: hypothetical protein Q9159_002655 [Coniocarpon cinnabarinum]
MRLDRPKGFIYFWLPHVTGSIQAAILTESSPRKVFETNLVLLVGTFWLRGATCIWNDVLDVDFDRQVARTRNRPLARGAVRIPPALFLMALEAAAAALTLRWLPRLCTFYSLPSIIGWIIYPSMKRVSNYPQVFLGFPMGWGALMGACAMDLDPLHFNQTSQRVSSSLDYSVLLLYAAHATWTISYETIYSYQDYADDFKVGVKSLTLLLRGHAKYFLASVSFLQLLILTRIGGTISASNWYYVSCVTCVGITLAWEIYRVNLADPASCQWWFANGSMITGFVWLGGLLTEYLMTKPQFGTF